MGIVREYSDEFQIQTNHKRRKRRLRETKPRKGMEGRDERMRKGGVH